MDQDTADQSTVEPSAAVPSTADQGAAAANPLAIDWIQLQAQAEELLAQVVQWAQSPAFYAQGALIAAALVVAWIFAGVVSRTLRGRLALAEGDAEASAFKRGLTRILRLVRPVLSVFMLGVGVAVADASLGQSVIVRLAQGLSVVALIYAATRAFFDSPAVHGFAKWVVVPIALLNVFGALDDVTGYLESIQVNVGNIQFSLYAIVRAAIFGAVLFWFGRLSNDSGKQYIRSRDTLEIGTREVLAKLFEIGLFVLIFLLMLQIMGINLTTLAVFGGALGVGLGFGLQAIASNFISGLIILLDRSLTVGDYIELEDGRTGTIRALNMRSTVLKTFDGKDVVVPNETFITSSFTNWTHTDPKQRYDIELQVAYSSDLEAVVALLREVVASHPQVLSGDAIPEDERPDAEISGFGDNGVDILIEYWMDGVDDGRNRVGADLNMMIWKAFKEAGVEFPFPQREVRLLNPSP
ncbi:MAG: mechanosensitive ion channel domain-containing protein [Pseudomonadota bacterium]